MRQENLERYLSAIEKLLNGMTYKEAGLTINISAERLRQVFHHTRRMMMNPGRLDVDFPDHDYWDIRQCRQHKDFWLRQTKKLKAEKGIA